MSSPGCLPVSSISFALPSTDCAANLYACALGMPSATAASAIASRNIKTYAGELPETPTTASIRCSGITSVLPKVSQSFTASAISSSVTSSLTQRAVIPSPTIAGVFGMVRMTFVFSPRRSPSHCKVLPGAIEIKICPAFTLSLISSRTPSRNCGFTARKTTSAKSTTCALVSAFRMPSSFSIFSRVLSDFAEAIISDASTSPLFRIPFNMAVAIFPQPIKPIFMIIFLLV